MSNVDAPGTDEYLVRLSLKTTVGAINIKDNDNGVLTSRTDVATERIVEYAGVSKGCNKTILGAPSDSDH